MRRTDTNAGRVRGSVALAVAGLLALLAAACKDPSIRVQNLGSAPARVSVTYYDSDGQQLTGDARDLAPGEGADFSIRSNGDLPKGFRGSAVIDSDQPVIALRQTIMSGRSADMLDGEVLAPPKGGGNLYLPLIMSRAGPWNTWSSRVFIQNMGDTPACVTLTYIDATSGSEVAYDPAKLTSKSKGAAPCPNGGTAVDAHATLYRDPSTFGVPDNFAGALRVDTSANSDGVSGTNEFLAASVDTWNESFNLLASYRGLTRSELSTRVVLPLIERDAGRDGSYGSRFQIVSGDKSKQVQVTLHVEGYDAAGNRVAKDSSFSFTGAKQCEQSADDAANCLSPGDTLPPGFSGYASVVASSAVGVVVQRGSYFGDYGSYRGLPEIEAGTRVALPAVNDRSWVRIRVLDGSAASITVRYTGAKIDGGEQTDSFTVDGTATAFQADAGLPGGFDGAAIIESDRPIVVVGWVDFGGGGDRALLYDGTTS